MTGTVAPDLAGTLLDVAREVARARALHPTPFHSPHEGFAVLLEEVDELKAHVWARSADRALPAMRAEAIQVAAMAVRFAAELCSTAGLPVTPQPAIATKSAERGGGALSAPADPVAAMTGADVAWSEARRAVLRRDWPAGRPVGDIRDELNAMSGRPRENSHIGVMAAYLGLKRPCALPPPAACPASPGRPVVTDLDTVRNWAAQRGLSPNGRDIAEVNAKRVQLGLSPFELEKPFAGRPRPGPAHANGA